LLLSCLLRCSSLFPYTTLFRSGVLVLDVIGDLLRRPGALVAGAVLTAVGGTRGHDVGVGQLLDPLEDLERLDHRVVGEIEEAVRSEEHTSELQSRENLVCRLLL